MRKLILILLFSITFSILRAQNPFEEYGYTPKVATLTRGQYNEFFDNDTIVQIGTVLYNTRSRKVVSFVDSEIHSSEATVKPDVVSRWMSPDPLVEQYPGWSPYNYVQNNPIKFIDPDGRDIEIFYGKNNSQSFVFNGKNGNLAPSNRFVSDFIKAYNYNIRNGGGTNLKEAATNQNLNILVKTAAGWGSQIGFDGTVYWDSDRALKGEWDFPLSNEHQDEYWISPATILEHEFDHKIGSIDDPHSYVERLNTKDDRYGNAEERRVITGSEKVQAEKNGEINKNQVRKDHGGYLKKVDDPIQNKPKEKELQNLIYPYK